MTILPPGATAPVLALRSLLLVLPCAALALALPEVPHLGVAALVVLCSTWWAHSPDHPAGAVSLLLVAGWWTAHGVVDWRVLVVGALLVAAHVVAVLAAYGPATLAVDPHLASRWLRRGLLVLVPMPVTYAAVRGLDPRLAPSWIWMATALVVVALLVATSRLTQPADE